jgi:dsRNA-specific ribonuclease
MNPMKNNFVELEKYLNISFNNKDLLIQAFCHRSYLNENPDFYLGHNERLEFLGGLAVPISISL